MTEQGQRVFQRAPVAPGQPQLCDASSARERLPLDWAVEGLAALARRVKTRGRRSDVVKEMREGVRGVVGDAARAKSGHGLGS